MESQVFLGILDEDVQNILDCSWTDNRIGGIPLFSPQLDLSKLNLACKNCAAECSFIFQIYCPVDSSSFDRIFYITLTKPVASEAICDTKSTKTKREDLFEDEWNDWGDNEEEEEEVVQDQQELTEKMSSLSFTSPTSNTRQFLEMFRAIYISVIEEPAKELNKKEAESLVSKANEVTDSDGQGEAYEKSYSNAFADNHTNYQFYKRISRYPSQLIRYEFGGTPLLFSDSPPDCPNCPLCGSKRTFELQLMPAMIHELAKIRLDPSMVFNLEFETVYVLSCSTNCSKKESQIHYEEVVVVRENISDQLNQLEAMQVTSEV